MGRVPVSSLPAAMLFLGSAHPCSVRMSRKETLSCPSQPYRAPTFKTQAPESQPVNRLGPEIFGA